jgi:hypothetical protein
MAVETHGMCSDAASAMGSAKGPLETPSELSAGCTGDANVGQREPSETFWLLFGDLTAARVNGLDFEVTC